MNPVTLFDYYKKTMTQEVNTENSDCYKTWNNFKASEKERLINGDPWKDRKNEAYCATEIG